MNENTKLDTHIAAPQLEMYRGGERHEKGARRKQDTRKDQEGGLNSQCLRHKGARGP